MTLQEYLSKCTKDVLVTEAIRSRDLEKALKLISQYLRKYKIYTMPNIRTLSVDGKSRLGIVVYNEGGEGACFVWELGNSNQIETVLFTKKADEMMVAWVNQEDFTWDVEVLSKGANTVQMCKLVQGTLTGKIDMNPRDIRAEIEDAQLFESVVNEASDDPIIAKLEKERSALYMKIRSWKKKDKDVSELEVQYNEIKKKLADAKLSIKGNVTTAFTVDKEEVLIQDQFEEECRATPEERFSDMESYIYNVILGIRPLALLCGAPGVGKTFRVKKLINGQNKVLGTDWYLLKGKCTPSALYMALHDYKDKGQLIVFDDCDSIFKDDDAVNLLKAAFDSDDERWVSWNVARPIPMTAEQAEMCDDAFFDSTNNRWYYPKEFLYEGGGVIITNYRAGQIDTAVRNRALICDLDFTTDEIIDLIRGLSPKIMPGILTVEAKEQALDYLQTLANQGAPVELSIRSFTLCAGIFGSDAPEASKKRRIKEQMRLQCMRGGARKY